MPLAYCTTKNKITIMTTESPKLPYECPYNWQSGWPEGVYVGCCGQEVPSRIGGRWYIYVWIKPKNIHQYYCFEDDLFYSDTYFENYIRNL